MDPTAITDKAKELNATPGAWESGAERAARQDLRRSLILACPSDRWLDQEHLQDCIDEVATWAPDVIRQRALRHAGGNQLRGLVLSPSQFDALVAKVRAPGFK